MMSPSFHVPEAFHFVHEDGEMRVDDERKGLAELESVEKSVAHTIEPGEDDVVFAIASLVSVCVAF